MKSIRDFNLKDKKVLVRADFNVPINNHQKISDQEDWRLEATLPTINYLQEKGAKIILMAHLGRPGGKKVEYLKLDSVGQKLSELLGKKVLKLDDCFGKEVKKKVENLSSGEIILLENLRFYKEEEENDDHFAKQLAELGDLYINDAFAVSHRAHASVVGLPKYLESGSGLLLEKEIKTLAKVLDNPDYPLAVIMGGKKITTKIKVIKSILKKADDLILAGALANVVISAKGIAIGSSITDENMIEEVHKLDLTDTKIHIPVDVIACYGSEEKSPCRVSPVGHIKEKEMILDIGPDTCQIFKKVISQAKTIIWNGPMGLMEIEKFAKGSQEIAEAVAQNNGFSVVGGGDTISFLEKINLREKMNHVSTGGAAMLSFLAREKLPGIEALG